MKNGSKLWIKIEGWGISRVFSSAKRHVEPKAYKQTTASSHSSRVAGTQFYFVKKGMQENKGTKWFFLMHNEKIELDECSSAEEINIPLKNIYQK
jgi:hypothetical protein